MDEREQDAGPGPRTEDPSPGEPAADRGTGVSSRPPGEVEQDVEDLIEPAAAPGEETGREPAARRTADPDYAEYEVDPFETFSGESGDAGIGSGLPTLQRAQVSGVDGPREPEEDPLETKELAEAEGEVRRLRATPRLVVAFASGKGGVGKSVLAASVAIYLAQLGKKVVAVDANLSVGNLHTLLGMDEPRLSLSAFLRKEVQQIEEVVSETPFSGLGLIPSNDNAYGSANPRPVQKNRLLSQLRSLPAEYVVIDLAAGTDYNTLDILLAADLHVVVTVPEPTAIEGAFRLIKSAVIRKFLPLGGVKQLLEDLRPVTYGGIPTPYQVYLLARERDPGLGEALYASMAEFKPRLVVNKTRTRDDLELGHDLTVVGRRHLALPFDYLGYVENDDMVWVTVRRRRPLLVEYPEAKVSRDIERIARRILSLETKERPECLGVPRALLEQNYYELLGLHPGATREEVRRAQRRVRHIYSPDSATIFGVAPPGEVHQMYRRIEEAHVTLVDPEKRHLYNQSIFPGGRGMDQVLPPLSPLEIPPRPEFLQEQEITPLEPLPEMPTINSTTEFSGDLLRQIREARGVELQDIAERTKITRTYLRAIEDEDFLSTPAPVYLRGFVKTMARELKLDPEQVARSYMSRYEQATRR